MSLIEFGDTLKELARKLEINIGTVQRKITFDLFGRITLKTPVDTGRARASWDVTVGEPTEWVPPAGTYGGPKAIADLEIKGDRPTYIVSNLEYMEHLEHGSSQQAPAGMVAISVLETQQEAQNIIAQLS